MRVDDLVEAHNVWVLKLLHGFHFTLNFLLHTELADLELVEDLECDGLSDGFIYGDCRQRRQRVSHE